MKVKVCSRTFFPGAVTEVRTSLGTDGKKKIKIHMYMKKCV